MSKQWQGPTRAKMWKVDEADGTISAWWDGIELTPVVSLAKKLEQPLEVVVDIETFLEKQAQGGWTRVVSGHYSTWRR